MTAWPALKAHFFYGRSITVLNGFFPGMTECIRPMSAKTISTRKWLRRLPLVGALSPRDVISDEALLAEVERRCLGLDRFAATDSQRDKKGQSCRKHRPTGTEAVRVRSGGLCVWAGN
jgi:hypothetical protein